MARLAAALALEVDPATLEAARANAGALSGVSPERIQGELARIFEKPHAHRAVALLGETGVLARALPGQPELHPGGLDLARAQSLRIQALRALPEPIGLELGLSVLLDPSPLEPFADSGDFEAAERALDLLKPSRATRRAVVELASRAGDRALASSPSPPVPRVRIVRDPHEPQTMRLARAWHQARGAEQARSTSARLRARLSAEELRRAARRFRPGSANASRRAALGALLEAGVLQLGRRARPSSRVAQERVRRRMRRPNTPRARTRSVAGQDRRRDDALVDGPGVSSAQLAVKTSSRRSARPIDRPTSARVHSRVVSATRARPKAPSHAHASASGWNASGELAPGVASGSSHGSASSTHAAAARYAVGRMPSARGSSSSSSRPTRDAKNTYAP
jgi:hypothetical protein